MKRATCKNKIISVQYQQAKVWNDVKVLYKAGDRKFIFWRHKTDILEYEGLMWTPKELEKISPYAFQIKNGKVWILPQVIISKTTGLYTSEIEFKVFTNDKEALEFFEETVKENKLELT